MASKRRGRGSGQKVAGIRRPYARAREGEVAAALAAVLETGSVPEAARRTGVPERTLREWRISPRWAGLRDRLGDEHREALDDARQAAASAVAESLVAAADAAVAAAKGAASTDTDEADRAARTFASLMRGIRDATDVLGVLAQRSESSRPIRITIQPGTAVPTAAAASSPRLVHDNEEGV